MFLITETINDIGYITEEVNGKKELFIEGVFLESERKNRNGRIYPSGILEREVDKYRTEYIDTRRALGELEHPERATIMSERVSHLITELNREGNNYRGKAKVLDTPMGNIIRGILEGGAQIGVSSRGMGSTKSVNGINEVQSDYELCTIDAVLNPSAIDAYTEMVYENHIWIPGGKQVIEELTTEELHDPREMLKVFEQLMKRL